MPLQVIISVPVARRARTFWRSRRGSVQALFGLVLPCIVGFVGLGVDASFWMMERTTLQAATDSAAISAAHSRYLGGSGTALTAEAASIVGKLYNSEAPSVVIDVNAPPESGAYAGSASAVEVITEKRQPLYFSRLFHMDNVKVVTRTVALVNVFSDNCILALGTRIARAVQMTGSSTVDIGCGIASNSTSNESVYASGSTTLRASSISAVGDIYRGGSANVQSSGGPLRPHSPQITDPYGPSGRNLQAPSLPTACTERNLTVRGNTTLSPGRYCGGIRFQGGTTTLQPGTYIVDGGDFRALAGASISGTGVTIVLTGSGTNYGQLDINGNASLSLHAPTGTGTGFDGVLFYQDRNAPSHQGNQLNSNTLLGGASLSLTGALYFPNQEIVFSGGSSSQASCIQIVGLKVTFSGNGSLLNSCAADADVAHISRISIDVVE